MRHNFEMYNDFVKGDEGIEFVKHERNPEEFNLRKFEKEVRAQLTAMEQEEPEIAKALKEKILSG